MKRAIAGILAMFMLLLEVPLGAFAATDNYDSGVKEYESSVPNYNSAVTGAELPTQSTLEYVVYYGSVSEMLEGDGSESSPYLIKSGADLKYFEQQVNGGNSYSGKHIRLEANIDYNGYGWTPIGLREEAPFSGHFDGNGHEIKRYFIMCNDGISPPLNKVGHYGFFGYIKDARIEDLGLVRSRIVQTYVYDAVMGTLVGTSENSTVTNCYADVEHLGASFGEYRYNDFDFSTSRNLTHVKVSASNYNYVIPQWVTVPGEENSLIYDFTNSSVNWNVTSEATFIVPSNVSAVKFVGISGKQYPNIKIVVYDSDEYSCYIELENMNMPWGSTLSVSGDREIYLKSSGTKNSLCSTSGFAVNMSSAKLTVIAEAPLDIRSDTIGFSGADSTQTAGTGVTGGSGHAALIAKELYMCGTGTVSIYGGRGGQGGSGGKGATGSPGWDRAWVWQGTAGNGGTGGQGGKGGTGGIGGAPVATVTPITVQSGTLNLYGGAGGTGGDGGKGGTGGRGGNNTAWGGGTGNGGQGGKGGTGGDGGAYFTYSTTTHIVATTSLAKIQFLDLGNGPGGAGGPVGDGGAKGTANSMCGDGGRNGSLGALGDSGAAGSQPTHNDTIQGANTANATVKVTKVSHADLIIGGLVGYLDRDSVLSDSIVIINSVSVYNQYSYNDVTSGLLCGKADGKVKGCDSVTLKVGKYERNPESGWFGQISSSEGAAVSDISYLSSYTGEADSLLWVDSQGLIYDNAIGEDNRIADERTLYLSTEDRESIRVPSCVYSGKFICDVTKIYDGAFASDTSMKSVHLGMKVRETGRGILSGCTALETITIGASLTEIAELDLLAAYKSQVPFGLEKSTASRLVRYEVEGENPVFASEDGILYELFNINTDNEAVADYVKIAIIDAPVNAPVTRLEPSAHVLKIYPGAFKYNRTLSSVTLNYVTEIGDSAFYSAIGLCSVTIGRAPSDEQEYVEILGERYEAGKEKFTQKIGINAFSGCSSLSFVDLSSDNITTIGAGAFSLCATAQGVTPLSLVFGKNLSAISANYDQLVNDMGNSDANNGAKNFHLTFAGSNIASFTVDSQNIYYMSKDGVLYLRTGKVENGAENVWLIAYPNRRETGELTVDCFDGYRPTRIGQSAFAQATGIGVLNVADVVEGIDNGAFHGSGIHTLNIGKGVRYIGSTVSGAEEMFSDCAALGSINVETDNGYYCSIGGVLYNKAVTKLIKYPQQKSGYEFSPPESVCEIGGYSFAGNLLVRRVTFTSQITRVGYRAFKDCINMSIVYFREGASPFASRSAVEDSGAFETANPRTVICYGSGDSSWEAVSGEYFNFNNEKLYSVDKFTGYPSDKTGSGWYAFVVVDSTGAPINDVYVELSGELEVSKKTTDGIATFSGLEYGVAYKLRVIDNNGEFYPIENTEFYPDEATRVTYITLSTVPTVAGVSVKYNNKASDKVSDDDVVAGGLLWLVEVIGGSERSVDINSQSAQINRWAVDKMAITVSCGFDDDFKVLGYRLIQGNTMIKTYYADDELITVTPIEDTAAYSGKSMYNVTFEIDTASLIDGGDIYFVLEFQNHLGEAQKVDTKLNIELLTLDLYPVNAEWATGGIKFTVDESLPFIGGAELEIGSDDYKPKVSVGVGDDYFRIIVGNIDRDFKFGDNYEEKNSLRNWGSYVDAIKNGRIKDSVLFEDEMKNKVGLSLDGYIEIKHKGIDAEGNADIATTVSLTGTVKYTLSVGSTRQVLFIPVRVDVELSLEGSATLKLVFDKEAKQFCTPDFTFTFKGGISAYAGIGCKLASAGIYGEITMVLVLDIYSSKGQTGDEGDHWFNLNEWKLSGDIGLYVKYDGLFVRFKKTWSIFEGAGFDGEWIIYGDGKWFPEVNSYDEAELVYSMGASALYNSENYEIAESEENDGFDIAGITDSAALEGAYASISPRLIDMGDVVYVVYQQNLAGYADYDAYNYQKLVYQLYYKDTDSFSEVYILDDNGYADGAFDVYADAENAAIVFTQLNKRLDTDNIDDIAGYVGALDVKCAVLGEGGFEVSEYLGADSYYDLNPRINYTDGALSAVWVKCENNDMLGMASEENRSSIWCSRYIDGEWTEPSLVAGQLSTVCDVELGADSLVYITDTNYDLTTVAGGENGYNDRMVYELDLDGSVVRYTALEGAYHDAEFIDGEPVYYCEGGIYTLGEDAALLRDGVTLGESYTVMYDADGNARALLYVDNVEYPDGAAGSDIFALFNDGEGFGHPVQLTDFGGGVFVSSFDAAEWGDKIILSVLTTMTEYTGGDDYEHYTTENTFDTYAIEYPTGYTLGDISYVPQLYRPGDDIIVNVAITNNSAERLDALLISVTRAGDSFGSRFIGYYDVDGKYIGDTLPSGMSGYIRISFESGEASEVAYIVSLGERDYTADVWKSDLAVFGKHVVIGSAHRVIASVTNLGYIESAPTTLVAEFGDVTLRFDIDSLGRAETRFVSIPVPTSYEDESILLSLSLGIEGEHVSSNNTAQVLVSCSDAVESVIESLHVWISRLAHTIDRQNVADISFEYDTYYTVSSISINDTEYYEDSGAYCVSDGRVVICGEYFEKLLSDDGDYDVTISFLDPYGVKHLSYAELKLTSFYNIIWQIDGEEIRRETLEQGSVPFASEAQKSADAQFTYVFVGWDCDGDGEADEMCAVDGDVTYVALFENVLNSYSVTWIVGEDSYIDTYFYGSQPSFDGNTEKLPDGRIYDFCGWDKEIGEVIGDVVYIAQYLSYEYGDYDKDGEISNTDLTMLVRYLSGWRVDEVYYSADGDNVINNRDAIFLIRKLAAWIDKE